MDDRKSGLSALVKLQQEMLTRRALLSRGAAIGAAGLLASSRFSPAAFASGPKKGGRLRIGSAHGSTTDSLNPATITNGFTSVISMTKDNHLGEFTTEGLKPELAESWEPSPDAKIWRFKLRKGVEFHNGKTVDVNDVVASINHHRQEDSTSSVKSLLRSVTEIRVDGSDIVVSLDSGNADFPYVLSQFPIAILPANGDGTIDWQSGIGCGPYKITEWEPGVRAEFVRHESYWKLPDRAHFDEVEVLALLDNTGRLNALISGEVDVIDRIEFQTASRIANLPNINLLEAKGNAHYSFAMRTDLAPFENNEIRLALKHAIDRQKILDYILNGYGYLGNDQPIGRAYPYRAEDLPQREYDVDKAKFHLKQAGLSSLKVDLSAATAAYPGAVDAATLYSEDAAKAGIEINVVREPNDGYWSNVWRKKPFCSVYWSGRETPDMMFTSTYAAGASWNDTFWNNDRFNELLVAARSELDDAKRREMYAEMQRIVRDDGGAVIPVFYSFLFPTVDKIQHGELAINRDLDGYKLAERWWFA